MHIRIYPTPDEREVLAQRGIYKWKFPGGSVFGDYVQFDYVLYSADNPYPNAAVLLRGKVTCVAYLFVIIQPKPLKTGFEHCAAVHVHCVRTVSGHVRSPETVDRAPNVLKKAYVRGGLPRREPNVLKSRLPLSTPSTPG
jgi:hypothetical protein